MIESITKKSDGVFEEFDVCVSGKHHIFDWKHYDQMIEFLDEVSKDTVNASKYVKAEIKKIKEEEKTDPEKVAEKKKDRRIKTIVSLLIAGFIAGGGISIFYETAKILGEIWHLIGTIFVASVGAGAVSYFGLNEYLKNPRLYELEKDEKELKNDYEIIKDLRRHICLNQMHKTESNDRFSKYNEGKPSLFRRIALIMGSKPETYYEHIVHLVRTFLCRTSHKKALILMVPSHAFLQNI